MASPARPSLDDLSPGDVFAERFAIEAELGEGGFGRVFRARHTVTRGLCALKALRPALLDVPALRERFATEVRAAGEIGSAHVVGVHDVGVDAVTGAPWIAMEYLQGETLDAKVKRDGPLSREDARRYFAQLGDAFGAAHDRGVIHLDLKPENLFLANTGMRESRGPVLKVLDFGIARLLSDGRTHATVDAAIGSPLWMAPEQSEVGNHVRPSADVWAMGLVVFYALTGAAYWRAGTRAAVPAVLLEVLTSKLDGARARAKASGVDPALFPPGFDAWFAQCVDRNPAARFQHGRAAMRALVQVLDGASPDATVMLTEPPRAPSLAPVAPPGDHPAMRATVALPSGVVQVPVLTREGEGAAAAWRTKGECSVQLGMAEAAVGEFSRAIALHPRDPRALRGRAQAWRALGRAELAEADDALAGALGG